MVNPHWSIVRHDHHDQWISDHWSISASSSFILFFTYCTFFYFRLAIRYYITIIYIYADYTSTIHNIWYMRNYEERVHPTHHVWARSRTHGQICPWPLEFPRCLLPKKWVSQHFSLDLFDSPCPPCPPCQMDPNGQIPECLHALNPYIWPFPTLMSQVRRIAARKWIAKTGFQVASKSGT
jgi:hypothetical protein